MKKFIVALAIASTALTAAAPAAAQYQGRDRYDDRGYGRSAYRPVDVNPRLHRISQQISRGLERGAITNGEARRLRGELQQLWRLASRFHQSRGYSPRESAELNRRINWLQDQVRFERRDNDRRNWR